MTVVRERIRVVFASEVEAGWTTRRHGQVGWLVVEDVTVDASYVHIDWGNGVQGHYPAYQPFDVLLTADGF